MPVDFCKFILKEHTFVKVPHNYLILSCTFIFQKKYYELAPLNERALDTRNQPRICHSHIDSNDIHQSLATIVPCMVIFRNREFHAASLDHLNVSLMSH
jgi:hypothetical protein